MANFYNWTLNEFDAPYSTYACPTFQEEIISQDFSADYPDFTYDIPVEQEPLLEEFVRTVARSEIYFQSMETSMQNMSTQLSQVITFLSESKAQESGHVPSPTIEIQEELSPSFNKVEEQVEEIEIGEEIEARNEIEVNHQFSLQVSATMSQEEKEDLKEVFNPLPYIHPINLAESKREEPKKTSVRENMSIVIQREIPNNFKFMKYPADCDSIISINIVDFSMQETLEFNGKVDFDSFEEKNGKQNWIQIKGIEMEQNSKITKRTHVLQPLFLQLTFLTFRNTNKFLNLYLLLFPTTWGPPRLVFDPGGTLHGQTKRRTTSRKATQMFSE